jgi:hypothetical protein
MKPIRVFLKSLLTLVAVALSIFAIAPEAASFLPDAVAQALLGAGGVGFAMATASAQAVQGTVTTTEVGAASPNLLRPEISQLITKIRPDVFPLDTILREVGNVGKCDSREYKYYSSDVRGVRDLVTANVLEGTSALSELIVQNVHIWTVDDVMFIPGVVDSTGLPIRAQVVSTDASLNKLVVSAINGIDGAGNPGDWLPAIPQDTPITRIGSAKDEIAAQSTPYANLLTDTYNYVQIFMCQVEESFVNLQHNKEVEYNINDYRTDAIFDMRRQGELSMLFGYPKKDFFDSVSGKRKDFMGGALHFVTKTITYDPTTPGTNADFNNWAKQIFTGNNGSYKRVVFAGNGLIEWLMNVPVVEKQLQANKSEIVAGIKFKVIETYFGDLLVRRHQGMDDVEGYVNNGIVFDLENVERRFREVTNSEKLELDRTGIRRVNAYRIVEAWTMAFRNPETHAWIKAV